MKTKNILLTLSSLLILSNCGGEKKESITEGGMKCGAGKCGSSMVDGSAVLVKKKMNILNQLKKEDKRRDCVLKAKTTKALYNCVRLKSTGRLSKNYNVAQIAPKVIKKEENKTMKCETGKCTVGK